jgi:iron complex outermembrane receptor protein
MTDFTESQMAEKRYRLNFNLRHRNQKFKGLNYGINGNFMYNDTKLMLAWLDDSAGFYRAYPGGVLLQNKFIFYLDPYINYYTALGTKHSLKTRYLYNTMDMSNDQTTTSSIVYADYSFRKDFPYLADLKFISGISTQWNSVLSDMYVGSGNRLNTLLNVSPYLEIQNEILKTLNLSFGVRLEAYSLNGETADLKPIFRAGATLKVLQGTFVRGSYGQGYRYPTIAERFIRFSSGVIGVFNNPDLEPETSINAEIGVKQVLKFKEFYGFLDISVFQQNYENTIEYLFGFWDSTYTFAIGGFKFMNTGKSRILGADISLTGKAALTDDLLMNIMLGYTYIQPKSMDPDYVFAVDYSHGGGKEYSYNTTSVNPEKQILKYRYLHTFKGDVEFDFKGFSTGLSMKYYSPIENIDKSIEKFEEATAQMGGTTQPVKYMNYFYHHNNGNFTMDFRISYLIKETHKIALIVNNVADRWYSIRPLKAESIRNLMIQYTLNL